MRCPRADPNDELGRLEHELSIRQLVIVPLGRVLKEVLDEFPIVALGIVEVPLQCGSTTCWIQRRHLSIAIVEGMNPIFIQKPSLPRPARKIQVMSASSLMS